jgi:hypothetical protein
MARIHLVHWHPEEAAEHAKQLRALGHTVACEQLNDPAVWKGVRQNPPDAFVICLDRLPSHGHEIAGGLLGFKATRNTPIVFVGGEPDKVERVKAKLPDAHYASWRGIGGAIKRAMANPPSLAALPAASTAGYSGTPLPKKLGIKEGSTVALLRAPADFTTTLGSLPAGVRLHSNPRGKRNLTVWFVGSLKELKTALPRMVEASQQGHVWIAWPKQTSGVKTDVNETLVRNLGLAAGLVDFKICAIDQTWSGLCFALRNR